MISDALKKIVAGQNLSADESAEVMSCIMEGQATPVQIGAFLVALRMKGETSEEISGFARSMREHSIKVPATRPVLVDTCGTGGAARKTFNISTTSAFIAAGAGVAVAKHGNRAASSLCGSADVLEALGVNLDVTPERLGKIIDEVGVGFLFARALHPAMKFAAPVRSELGVRTVFNMLGPLTNPAGAKRQVLGVFEPWGVELLAGALQQLGTERAMVVHGLEGLDEISTLGETMVSEVKDGGVKSYSLKPSDVGLKPGSIEEIGGGDAAHNAEVFQQVLSGGAPAAREIACLNAAAALYVAGVVDNLQDGLAKADISVSSGAAEEVFRMYKDRTNQTQ